MRTRELELEIARLNAEIESMRGEGDPTDIAARFLAMAASTVDQAMDEARREADEFAAEISAEAEARRDEASRLAEEAERRADALRVEADQSESVVRKAEEDADQIRADAEREASELVTAERARLADELEVLSGVRTALEEERSALESYHEELQRRVQELAESMVAFMTTEPPIAAVAAIDELAARELDAAPAAETPDVSAPDDSAHDNDPATDAESPEAADQPIAEPASAVDGFSAVGEFAAEPIAPPVTYDDPTTDAGPFDSDIPAAMTFDAEAAAHTAEPSGESPAEPMAFVEYVVEPAPDAAVASEPPPDAPVVPEPAPGPPSFQDMMTTPAPADEFAGVPVVDDPAAPPARGGLFGRATADEQVDSVGLFGNHGARLIEQTSPEDLAAALADEDDEDQRFQSFIHGDDDADPSRDWLLRPEQQ